MTIKQLDDVVRRTVSVMEEQRDDNGELIADANHELYADLKEVCVATAPDGFLARVESFVTTVAGYTDEHSPEDRDILSALIAEAKQLELLLLRNNERS
jgi:hypothetical protein